MQHLHIWGLRMDSEEMRQIKAIKCYITIFEDTEMEKKMQK